MDARFGEMLDTSAEGRAMYYDMLARMTPAARAQKVAALGRAARALARAGIQMNRPAASSAEIEIELIARLYGADVARQLLPYLSHPDRD